MAQCLTVLPLRTGSVNTGTKVPTGSPRGPIQAKVVPHVKNACIRYTKIQCFPRRSPPLLRWNASESWNIYGPTASSVTVVVAAFLMT
jgi:hypothetical protein